MRHSQYAKTLLALLLSSLLLAAHASERVHAQFAWVPQGPGPTTNGQVEGIADGEVAGAINVIAAHPTDPNTAYIGAVNGGVWKTTNARDTHPDWQPLTDDQASLSIGALEFDPTDSSHETLVAGIGNASSLGWEGGARTGILRTTNGGATWTAIGRKDLAGLNIRGIAPRGATIVVAVNDAGAEDAKLGIWRSLDTGTTWTQISGKSGSGLPGGSTTDLATDPADPKRLFTNAGLTGIYRSLDTGATWTRVGQAAMDVLIEAAGNVRIVVGPGNYVYVAVADADSKRLSGIFSSPNGGATWIAMDLPGTREGGIHPGRQGTIHLSLAADAAASQTVYMGGDRQPGPDTGYFPKHPNSIGARDYAGRLFRGDASKPFGSQWVHLTHSSTAGAAGGGTGHNSAPHGDSRDMAMAADGSLIEVDDGGIYRRASPLKSTGDWVSMNGNLQVTEFHAVAWDATAHVTVGGAQDTGTPQQNSRFGRTWSSVSTSDGGVVAVDTRSAPGFSILYSSYLGLDQLRRRVYSTPGVFQSTVEVPLTPHAGHDPMALNDDYTPIKLNAVDPLRIVFGGENGVYESFDQGDRIAAIGPAIRVNRNAIAYGARGNADALYVGADSHVFVRTSAKTSLARSVAYKGGRVMGVAIDLKDAKTAVVIDPDHVYRTTDSGKTWKQITGNLTALAAGRLWSTTYRERAVIVGTDRGVFQAEGPAFTLWTQLGTGLPKAPVFSLEYAAADRIVLAGTLGRGAWTLTTPGTPPHQPSTLVGAVSLQTPRTPDAGFQLRSGVVIDPERGRVYIAKPGDTVEAVTLSTGQVLWTSADAVNPLGFSAGRLIAQADAEAGNTLKIAVLDPSTGARTGIDTWSLPAGVSPSFEQTPDGRFLAGVLPGDGTAIVIWRFETRARRGVRPDTPDALKRPSGRRGAQPAQAIQPPSMTGAIRLDLKTGAMSPADPTVASLEAFAALDAPYKIFGLGVKTPGLPRNQMLSIDGRYVLTSQRIANDPSWDKYQWTIHERSTNTRLGQLKSHVSAAPFYVSDSILVYETGQYTRRVGQETIQEPLKVRAFDLKTSSEIWNKEVRDPAPLRLPPR